MVQRQLEATKASLKTAAATEAQTISINNQRLSALGAEEGYIDLGEEQEKLTQANVDSIGVLAKLKAGWEGFANLINTVIARDWGNVKGAFAQGYNASLEESNELLSVNWEARYSGFSDE